MYYDSQWIEIGGTGSGARMHVSTTPPDSQLEGSLWFDSNIAKTFIYYDSQWVDIGDIVSSSNVGVSSIDTEELVDGSVTEAKLASSAVSSSKLGSSSVIENKIATNAVTTTKILDGAVTSAKLANGVIPQSLGTGATVQFQNLTLTRKPYCSRNYHHCKRQHSFGERFIYNFECKYFWRTDP